jgi:transcriptional regulator with XRE-family HTH domain
MQKIGSLSDTSSWRAPSVAGRFLKAYRQLHALTQEKLAERLAMQPRLLRAYENGERQLNNIQELRRIADTLGVKPEYLGVASLILVLEVPERREVPSREREKGFQI